MRESAPVSTELEWGAIPRSFRTHVERTGFSLDAITINKTRSSPDISSKMMKEDGEGSGEKKSWLELNQVDSP